MKREREYFNRKLKAEIDRIELQGEGDQKRVAAKLNIEIDILESKRRQGKSFIINLLFRYSKS